MRTDIKDYVNSCMDCLAKKKPLLPDAGSRRDCLAM